MILRMFRCWIYLKVDVGNFIDEKLKNFEVMFLFWENFEVMLTNLSEI
jgi:hypothetical protein